MAKGALGLVGVLMFVLVACSSSDDEDNASPDAACATASDSLCKKLMDCLPDTFSNGYSDVAACSARAKISCLAQANAPGTAFKTSDFTLCGNGYAAATCESILGNGATPPDACKPKPGGAVAGAKCQDDSQCASAYCKFGTDSCGACGTRAAAGGKCDNANDCELGLECNGTCVGTVNAGEPCSDEIPCKGTLICKTTGVADAKHSGTCAVAANAGDPCTGNECDAFKALICNPSSKTCQKITFADPGGACGVISGGLVGCRGPGSVCEVASSTNLMGTCKPGLADGAACGDSVSGDCQRPARCINAVCTLPTTCGG